MGAGKYYVEVGPSTKVHILTLTRASAKHLMKRVITAYAVTSDELEKMQAIVSNVVKTQEARSKIEEAEKLEKASKADTAAATLTPVQAPTLPTWPQATGKANLPGLSPFTTTFLTPDEKPAKVPSGLPSRRTSTGDAPHFERAKRHSIVVTGRRGSKVAIPAAAPTVSDIPSGSVGPAIDPSMKEYLVKAAQRRQRLAEVMQDFEPSSAAGAASSSAAATSSSPTATAKGGAVNVTETLKELRQSMKPILALQKAMRAGSASDRQHKKKGGRKAGSASPPASPKSGSTSKSASLAANTSKLLDSLNPDLLFASTAKKSSTTTTQPSLPGTAPGLMSEPSMFSTDATPQPASPKVKPRSKPTVVVSGGMPTTSASPPSSDAAATRSLAEQPPPATPDNHDAALRVPTMGEKKGGKTKGGVKGKDDESKASPRQPSSAAAGEPSVANASSPRPRRVGFDAEASVSEVPVVAQPTTGNSNTDFVSHEPGVDDPLAENRDEQSRPLRAKHGVVLGAPHGAAGTDEEHAADGDRRGSTTTAARRLSDPAGRRGSRGGGESESSLPHTRPSMMVRGPSVVAAKPSGVEVTFQDVRRTSTTSETAEDAAALGGSWGSRPRAAGPETLRPADKAPKQTIAGRRVQLAAEAAAKAEAEELARRQNLAEQEAEDAHQQATALKRKGTTRRAAQPGSARRKSSVAAPSEGAAGDDDAALLGHQVASTVVSSPLLTATDRHSDGVRARRVSLLPPVGTGEDDPNHTAGGKSPRDSTGALTSPGSRGDLGLSRRSSTSSLHPWDDAAGGAADQKSESAGGTLSRTASRATGSTSRRASEAASTTSMDHTAPLSSRSSQRRGGRGGLEATTPRGTSRKPIGRVMSVEDPNDVVSSQGRHPNALLTSGSGHLMPPTTESTIALVPPTPSPPPPATACDQLTAPPQGGAESTTQSEAAAAGGGFRPGFTVLFPLGSEGQGGQQDRSVPPPPPLPNVPRPPAASRHRSDATRGSHPKPAPPGGAAPEKPGRFKAMMEARLTKLAHKAPVSTTALAASVSVAAGAMLDLLQRVQTTAPSTGTAPEEAAVEGTTTTTVEPPPLVPAPPSELFAQDPTTYAEQVSPLFSDVAGDVAALADGGASPQEGDSSTATGAALDPAVVQTAKTLKSEYDELTERLAALLRQLRDPTTPTSRAAGGSESTKAQLRHALLLASWEVQRLREINLRKMLDLLDAKTGTGGGHWHRAYDDENVFADGRSDDDLAGHHHLPARPAGAAQYSVSRAVHSPAHVARIGPPIAPDTSPSFLITGGGAAAVLNPTKPSAASTATNDPRRPRAPPNRKLSPGERQRALKRGGLLLW